MNWEKQRNQSPWEAQMNELANGTTPAPALDASRFVGSTYLAKEDIPQQGLTLTVAGAREETFEGKSKPRLVLEWAEEVKPLVLNASNTVACIRGFGVSDTGAWIGNQVHLSVDPNVMFSGKRVGGIVVTV